MGRNKIDLYENEKLAEEVRKCKCIYDKSCSSSEEGNLKYFFDVLQIVLSNNSTLFNKAGTLKFMSPYTKITYFR